MHSIKHGTHFVFGLTYRQSTDGNAECIERWNEFSGFRSQVRVDAALNNAEQSLIVARLCFE